MIRTSTLYKKTASVVLRSSNKLKFRTEIVVNDLLYKSRLKNHRAPDCKKIILCYHGIDGIGKTQLNSKFISRDNFEKQLIYFVNHFNIVSLKQFFDPNTPDSKKLTVALTFDDGYRNNYKYVLPLIEKYQISVTFFITGIRETQEEMLLGDLLDLATHFNSSPLQLGEDTFKKNQKGQYIRKKDQMPLKSLFHRSDFNAKKEITNAFPEQAFSFKKNPDYVDYWQQMSPEEIRALSKSKYATIGSHGYLHNDLSLQPQIDAVEDIKQSKRYLENIVQKEIVDLAFPYGNYSDQLIEECKRLGFKRLLALDYLSDKRVKSLYHRFGMNPYISWNNQLHYLLKGKYV